MRILYCAIDQTVPGTKGGSVHVEAVAVLEVNAPVIDHAHSRKALLDKVLVVQPMRRWRERLCNAADLIITPSADILPAATPRSRIVLTEWGADTVRFHPGATGPLRFVRPAGMLAVFAGAFRSWHGAVQLVRAVRLLRSEGRTDVSALLVGDGPMLPAARAEAHGLDGVIFTGAVAHTEMPAHLAAADVGVAPFDPAAHGPLSLGFYWSPLKIFEYMATGLPTAAPATGRIPELVRDGVEGLLYTPADHVGLAGALRTLTDPVLRARLGAAARKRAVGEYSWAAHCRTLEQAIEEARRAREGPSRH